MYRSNYLNNLDNIFYEILHFNVHRLSEQYSPYILLVFVIVGLILVYYGYKAHLNIIKGIGFIIGFVIGVLLAGAFMGNSLGASNYGDIMELVLLLLGGLFVGAIGAALALLINFILVFISGALITGFFTSTMMGFSQLNFDSTVVLVVAIFGGIAALFIYKLVYVLMTSFAGSIIMVAVITGSSFYRVFYEYQNYWFDKSFTVFWLFFISGIAVQFGTMKYIYNESFLSSR